MNIAILLAGGTGTRLGSDCPKQFLPLGDKLMFVHSLKTFDSHPMIDKIVLVCEKEHIAFAKEIIQKSSLNSDVIFGGKTRQESVYLGLCYVKDNFGSDNIVSIHDTARPFVSRDIITQNLKMAGEFGACTTVIPSQDTMLFSTDHTDVDEVPNRDNLYSVQTPQTFKFSIILNAHEQASNNTFTDDAGMVLSQGDRVKMVYGNKKNFKVTTKEDLIFANALLEN